MTPNQSAEGPQTKDDGAQVEDVEDKCAILCKENVHFCVKKAEKFFTQECTFPAKAFPTRAENETFTQKCTFSAPAGMPFDMKVDAEDEAYRWPSIGK